MQQSIVRRGVLALLLFTASASAAYWHNLLTDDFSEPGAWTYQGVTNSIGQPLLQHDPVNQVVQAEWDQSNYFDGSGDPYIILPSHLAHNLPRLLTDRDTFRFGAVLCIEPGSIPETIEFHQVGTFGLYNLEFMGADRAMSDNFAVSLGWVGEAVKDASDFVEFNYFVGNDPGSVFGALYRSVEATMGAHITGLEGDYYFNWQTLNDPFWHSTQMPDAWLPEGTNLYIELMYHGAATGAVTRRLYMAIYTEPERTNVLTLNGVPLYYWTVPLPVDKTFSLAQFAFQNYAAAIWAGSNVVGRGTYDDIYVDVHIAESEFFMKQMHADQLTLSVGTVSGTVYYLESCSDLSKGDWITNAQIQANGEVATFTNQPNGSMRIYRVSK